MGRQSGTGREDKTEFYARQWFASMAKFHRVTNPATWEFTEEHLIAFLRYKLKQNMPTWKRLKAVEGIIWYRNNVRKSSTPRLEMVRAKLQEMVVKEKEPKGEVKIDVVGKINPREPDVIQELRKKIRLKGHAYNTEKAYVRKVRAFMADRGLKTLADFQGIGAADVSAHLTDLAVDSDVAPSTQDQAFYALLFLFQHVLERDFGKIDAIRSTKAARIPTVMSKTEVSNVLDGDGCCLAG